MKVPNAIPEHGRCVVLLGSYGPSLEVFRGALISAMVADGDRVHALAGDLDARTAASLRKRGAVPQAIPLDRASVSPLGLVALYVRLRRLFGAIQPDVIIAYTIKPVVFGALANRHARFVAVITGLGYAFTDGKGVRRRAISFVARTLYRLSLKRASIILFQNPDDLADFRRAKALPAGAMVGLLNGSGVELDKFAPAPLPNGARFLMAARLLGDKGIREFAWAAKELKKAFPQAHVALAGFFDGSRDSIDRHELDTMIADGIEYLGHLDDVRPAIADSTVYVLPSYREGTPRSVLEAMAMGRAIITTDAPGCRETVVNGCNGLLVPPRDAAALADAMLALAGDPASVARMGSESIRIAGEKFDVRRVNDSLLRHAGLRT